MLARRPGWPPCPFRFDARPVARRERHSSAHYVGAGERRRRAWHNAFARSPRPHRHERRSTATSPSASPTIRRPAGCCCTLRRSSNAAGPVVRVRALAAPQRARQRARRATTRTSRRRPGVEIDRTTRTRRSASSAPRTSSGSPTCSRTRSTQTNEVGRCATFLPVLGLVAGEVGPLALVDVGSSGGLTLLLDRYECRYEPGGAVGGPSPVVLDVRHAWRRPDPRPVPARRRPDRSRSVTDRRHRPGRGAVARGLRLARPGRPVPPPARRDRPGPDRPAHGARR